jgi:hypothetical protein
VCDQDEAAGGGKRVQGYEYVSVCVCVCVQGYVRVCASVSCYMFFLLIHLNCSLCTLHTTHYIHSHTHTLTHLLHTQASPTAFVAFWQRREPRRSSKGYVCVHVYE